MWVLRASVLVTVLNIQLSTGENISTGKWAKQSSTPSYGGGVSYGAERALNATNSNVGSMTGGDSISWWMVDLAGFYTIHNISVTAWSQWGWEIQMQGAVVEVTDKDISLCPEARVTWCGNISDTVGSGEKFIFNCEPAFPVRFVRISIGPYTQLGLGHVEVHGHGRDKTNRSYYVKTQDKKVSHILQTVGAVMAAECGILCHQRHDCLHFSYSKTAPSDANCLLTNHPVPEYTTHETGWVLHTLEEVY